MKRLVIFYSRTGHVKKAAENYAQQHNCEAVEIRDLAGLSRRSGFAKGIFYSLLRRCSPIEPIDQKLSDYDVITICSPVWAGTFASPVRAFLSRYSGEIKQVEYIIVRADPKNSYEDVFCQMDEICGKKNIGAISLHEDKLYPISE